jgi:hypothetical protein
MRKNLQPSKEIIPHCKSENLKLFSIFVGHFFPPGPVPNQTKINADPDEQHCFQQGSPPLHEEKYILIILILV